MTRLSLAPFSGTLLRDMQAQRVDAKTRRHWIAF